MTKSAKPQLTSWSYSRLIDFEQCPYKVYLKLIKKVPEAKAEAAERGTKIHALAEDYVRGNITTLPVELKHFEHEFVALRRRHEAGEVSVEGEWGFNSNWEPTDYKTAWVKIKLDVSVLLNPKHILVIDHKTGKRFGNELKHGEQTLLYGIAAAIRNPLVNQITTELYYLDINDIAKQTYTRNQVFKYVPTFEKRANAMLTATEFPAKPNVFSCKYCAYGPAKGGQCEFGILPGDNAISVYRRKYG